MGHSLISLHGLAVAVDLDVLGPVAPEDAVGVGVGVVGHEPLLVVAGLARPDVGVLVGDLGDAVWAGDGLAVEGEVDPVRGGVVALLLLSGHVGLEVVELVFLLLHEGLVIALHGRHKLVVHGLEGLGSGALHGEELIGAGLHFLAIAGQDFLLPVGVLIELGKLVVVDEGDEVVEAALRSAEDVDAGPATAAFEGRAAMVVDAADDDGLQALVDKEGAVVGLDVEGGGVGGGDGAGRLIGDGHVVELVSEVLGPLVEGGGNRHGTDDVDAARWHGREEVAEEVGGGDGLVEVEAALLVGEAGPAPAQGRHLADFREAVAGVGAVDVPGEGGARRLHDGALEFPAGGDSEGFGEDVVEAGVLNVGGGKSARKRREGDFRRAGGGFGGGGFAAGGEKCKGEHDGESGAKVHRDFLLGPAKRSGVAQSPGPAGVLIGAALDASAFPCGKQNRDRRADWFCNGRSEHQGPHSVLEARERGGSPDTNASSAIQGRRARGSKW